MLGPSNMSRRRTKPRILTLEVLAAPKNHCSRLKDPYRAGSLILNFLASNVFDRGGSRAVGDDKTHCLKSRRRQNKTRSYVHPRLLLWSYDGTKQLPSFTSLSSFLRSQSHVVLKNLPTSPRHFSSAVILFAIFHFVSIEHLICLFDGYLLRCLDVMNLLLGYIRQYCSSSYAS